MSSGSTGLGELTCSGLTMPHLRQRARSTSSCSPLVSIKSTQKCYQLSQIHQSTHSASAIHPMLSKHPSHHPPINPSGRPLVSTRRPARLCLSLAPSPFSVGIRWNQITRSSHLACVCVAKIPSIKWNANSRTREQHNHVQREGETCL
jgi:hypothetical protein